MEELRTAVKIWERYISHLNRFGVWIGLPGIVIACIDAGLYNHTSFLLLVTAISVVVVFPLTWLFSIGYAPGIVKNIVDNPSDFSEAYNGPWYVHNRFTIKNEIGRKIF